MDANVAILTPAAVTLPIGVKCNTIYRTKVTLHSAKLFFKSQVEEPCLKFSNPGGGCGYIHGLLPTTKHDLQQTEATTLQCCSLHTLSRSQERRKPNFGEASY